MRQLLLSLLLFVTPPVSAQSDWQEALHDWLTAEDIEESYGEELMEQLEEQALSPINLNQTNREELEALPFLTAQQVEGVMEYIERYRPIRSLSELQMVKALDPQTRRLLSFFVVAGEEQKPSVWPPAGELLKNGKHHFMATGKIPFYQRAGDRNGYLGYRYRHDVRYQYTYNNRIKAGITAAQDAGEPFFSNKNTMGYDQYNYYLQLRDFGRLEELNVGHYRMQMGMGLVMNTRFQLGKLATLQTMGRSQHTLISVGKAGNAADHGAQPAHADSPQLALCRRPPARPCCHAPSLQAVARDGVYLSSGHRRHAERRRFRSYLTIQWLSPDSHRAGEEAQYAGDGCRRQHPLATRHAAPACQCRLHPL